MKLIEQFHKIRIGKPRFLPVLFGVSLVLILQNIILIKVTIELQ